MNRRIPVLSLSLVSMGLAALSAEPAAAQSSWRSQDVQLSVGEMFGDRLQPSALGLATVDLDAVWHVIPDFNLGGHKFSAYAEAGAGYEWANLDHQLFGFVGTGRGLNSSETTLSLGYRF